MDEIVTLKVLKYVMMMCALLYAYVYCFKIFKPVDKLHLSYTTSLECTHHLEEENVI